MAFAQEWGIYKVLGPIGERIAVNHYNRLKIYSTELTLIKEISKIDSTKNSTDQRASIHLSRINDFFVLAAVNKIYLVNKDGVEVSSAKVRMGRILVAPYVLKDNRIAVVSTYQLFGPPHTFISYFKVKGNKLITDGHIKIKGFSPSLNLNESNFIEMSVSVYLVDSKGDLVKISKSGKVTNISNGIGPIINSTIAKTKDDKIVFTIDSNELSNKVFIYDQNTVSSIELPFKNDRHGGNFLSLPNGDMALQTKEYLTVMDSNLKILKQVDLKSLVQNSSISKIQLINDSFISIVVSGSIDDRDPSKRLSGLLIYDLNLQLKKNLLNDNSSFSPQDTGVITKEGLLFSGDHSDQLLKIDLN